MKQFSSTNRQDINLNKFLSSVYFGNTNVIKNQSKFELNDFLIFLSNDKFKYCILPYLSGSNLVKIYLHFQNLLPKLNFQKFLPPSRYYIINNVLDIQEPTTYLQPLEINFLYNKFEEEYSSLKSNILYLTKSKIPNIINSSISIYPDSIFGLLSHNKIIPYEIYAINKSHQELLILKDDQRGQFYVTFQKGKDQFINIARGRGISETEFSDYVECIWEAYNLQGWKKCYWKIKNSLIMPYDKYLFYVVKIIFYLRSRLFLLCEIWPGYVESYHFLNILIFLSGIPFVVVLLASGYAILFLWYHATLLPFYILAFPSKHYILGFNWLSFWFVSPALASLYICVFSHLAKYFPFSSIEKETIEPKRIMAVVPLLIQNREMFLGKFFSAVYWCFVIFLLGFPYNVIFIYSGNFF